MVDKRLTGTRLVVTPVAERYECLTSTQTCGGSNPAEDSIWKSWKNIFNVTDTWVYGEK